MGREGRGGNGGEARDRPVRVRGGRDGRLRGEVPAQAGCGGPPAPGAWRSTNVLAGRGRRPDRTRTRGAGPDAPTGSSPAAPAGDDQAPHGSAARPPLPDAQPARDHAAAATWAVEHTRRDRPTTPQGPRGVAVTHGSSRDQLRRRGDRAAAWRSPALRPARSQAGPSHPIAAAATAPIDGDDGSRCPAKPTGPPAAWPRRRGAPSWAQGAGSGRLWW